MKTTLYLSEANQFQVAERRGPLSEASLDELLVEKMAIQLAGHLRKVSVFANEGEFRTMRSVIYIADIKNEKGGE